jgi:hypothetical protein
MTASTDCLGEPACLRRMAARVSIAAGATFIVLLGALHFLRPDLDPSWRFISEYEIGDFGWLMRGAFFALALCCASLGLALLHQARSLPGRLGLVLLAVSAAGMVLAGICLSDPATATAAEKTREGELHEMGAMLDLVPFAALLITWSLARHPAWRSVRAILLWTCWVPLAATFVFVAALGAMLPAHGGVPGPEVLVGWPNRIMILAHCGWVMLAAQLAARLPSSPPPTSTASSP